MLHNHKQSCTKGPLYYITALVARVIKTLLIHYFSIAAHPKQECKHNTTGKGRVLCNSFWDSVEKKDFHGGRNLASALLTEPWAVQ